MISWICNVDTYFKLRVPLLLNSIWTVLLLINICYKLLNTLWSFLFIWEMLKIWQKRFMKHQYFSAFGLPWCLHSVGFFPNHLKLFNSVPAFLNLCVMNSPTEVSLRIFTMKCTKTYKNLKYTNFQDISW